MARSCPSTAGGYRTHPKSPRGHGPALFGRRGFLSFYGCCFLLVSEACEGVTTAAALAAFDFFLLLGVLVSRFPFCSFCAMSNYPLIRFTDHTLAG